MAYPQREQATSKVQGQLPAVSSAESSFPVGIATGRVVPQRMPAEVPAIEGKLWGFRSWRAVLLQRVLPTTSGNCQQAVAWPPARPRQQGIRPISDRPPRRGHRTTATAALPWLAVGSGTVHLQRPSAWQSLGREAAGRRLEWKAAFLARDDEQGMPATWPSTAPASSVDQRTPRWLAAPHQPVGRSRVIHPRSSTMARSRPQGSR